MNDENSLNRYLHGVNTFKLYCITSFSRDVSLNLYFRIIKCFVKLDSRENNLVGFLTILNPFCWMCSSWNDKACKFTVCEFTVSLFKKLMETLKLVVFQDQSLIKGKLFLLSFRNFAGKAAEFSWYIEQSLEIQNSNWWCTNWRVNLWPNASKSPTAIYNLFN